VLVSGATGNTGSALLNELQGSGQELIAALTSADRKALLPDFCGYRLCNYDEDSQLSAALKNVDAAFLLVPFNEKMVDRGIRFVGHARRRNLRFILRLSGLAAAPDCGSKMGALHGRIDEAVKSSGISYCILRCNSFMQNFTGIYRGMIRRGILALPEGNAKSAFIDTRDIAAVAANILKSPSPHIGQVYDLTGPESLSNAQAVNIISSVTGLPVRYRAISDVETRQAYDRLGISPWRQEVLESLSRFIREGHAEKPTNTAEAILGRRPETFRSFAENHHQIWQTDK